MAHFDDLSDYDFELLVADLLGNELAALRDRASPKDVLFVPTAAS